MNQKNQRVIVLAEYHVLTENVSLVLNLIKQMQVESLKEKGCAEYKIYQVKDQETKVVLYEIYENEDALNQHRESLHFKDILQKKIIPNLESRTVTLLNEF